MKKYISTHFIVLFVFILPSATFTQNYFDFNGFADVLFRYEPRGSGGRAMVHESGNILALNYQGDFTGGVRIWGPLSIRNGSNYFNYNGGADVFLRYAGRGSGGRVMVHDTGNVLFFNYQGDFTGGTYIGGSKVIVNQGNVGIGTTTPDAELAVNGNIHTKEVKVDLIGWSDFVFDTDYNLPTFQEVEQHIKEKGHLKDIPSAEEVRKEGFFLGEMDSKLLQKIEELTLYTIEQQKEIETLEKQVSEMKELKEENKALKLLLERVTRLEDQLNTIQK